MSVIKNHSLAQSSVDNSSTTRLFNVRCQPLYTSTVHPIRTITTPNKWYYILSLKKTINYKKRKKKKGERRNNNNKLFIFYLQYAIVQQVSSQSTFTRLPQFFMILLYPHKLISFFTRIKLKRINVAPYSRNPEKGRRDSCSVSFFEEQYHRNPTTVITHRFAFLSNVAGCNWLRIVKRRVPFIAQDRRVLRDNGAKIQSERCTRWDLPRLETYPREIRAACS